MRIFHFIEKREDSGQRRVYLCFGRCRRAIPSPVKSCVGIDVSSCLKSHLSTHTQSKSVAPWDSKVKEGLSSFVA
ncbi:MAG: hypothetical protein EP326_08140 [Deltaproteobacteria bacterium]|nr:MAG: hypothetical protein EP326_08140 [Deltaproteobacteria bacterium]TNF30180.1 MAG: hypothetical protein EP319_05870 [Deltaproteobacteria bacterium]